MEDPLADDTPPISTEGNLTESVIDTSAAYFNEEEDRKGSKKETTDSFEDCFEKDDDGYVCRESL